MESHFKRIRGSFDDALEHLLPEIGTRSIQLDRSWECAVDLQFFL